MPTADTLNTILPFYMLDSIPWQDELPEVNTGIPLDSIFKPRDVADTVLRQSLFSDAALPVQHSAPLLRHLANMPAWYFVAIALLCLLTYIYYTVRKVKIKDVAQSLVDRRSLDRLVRNNNLTPMRLLPIGIITCVVDVLYAQYMMQPGTLLTVWLMVAAVVTVLYLLRWGLLRLLGKIFYCTDAVNTYINSSYLYHMAWSTVALPLMLLMIYMPFGNMPIMVAIAVLGTLCYVARLMRGVNVVLTYHKVRSFYLFYYLCIVEIAPLWVAITVLISQLIR